MRKISRTIKNSALGIFLVDMYPNSYHAMIGTGQMVDFAETERIDYAKALEILRINEKVIDMFPRTHAMRNYSDIGDIRWFF